MLIIHIINMLINNLLAFLEWFTFHVNHFKHFKGFFRRARLFFHIHMNFQIVLMYKMRKKTLFCIFPILWIKHGF